MTVTRAHIDSIRNLVEKKIIKVYGCLMSKYHDNMMIEIFYLHLNAQLLSCNF